MVETNWHNLLVLFVASQHPTPLFFPNKGVLVWEINNPVARDRDIGFEIF